MTINTGVDGTGIPITSARLIAIWAVLSGYTAIIHTVLNFSDFTRTLNACVYSTDVSITAPFIFTEAVNLTIVDIETSRVHAVVYQD